MKPKNLSFFIRNLKLDIRHSLASQGFTSLLTLVLITLSLLPAGALMSKVLTQTLSKNTPKSTSHIASGDTATFTLHLTIPTATPTSAAPKATATPVKPTPTSGPTATPTLTPTPTAAPPSKDGYCAKGSGASADPHWANTTRTISCNFGDTHYGNDAEANRYCAKYGGNYYFYECTAPSSSTTTAPSPTPVGTMTWNITAQPVCSNHAAPNGSAQVEVALTDTTKSSCFTYSQPFPPASGSQTHSFTYDPKSVPGVSCSSNFNAVAVGMKDSATGSIMNATNVSSPVLTNAGGEAYWKLNNPAPSNVTIQFAAPASWCTGPTVTPGSSSGSTPGPTAQPGNSTIKVICATKGGVDGTSKPNGYVEPICMTPAGTAPSETTYTAGEYNATKASTGSYKNGKYYDVYICQKDGHDFIPNTDATACNTPPWTISSGGGGGSCVAGSATPYYNTVTKKCEPNPDACPNTGYSSSSNSNTCSSTCNPAVNKPDVRPGINVPNESNLACQLNFGDPSLKCCLDTGSGGGTPTPTPLPGSTATPTSPVPTSPGATSTPVPTSPPGAATYTPVPPTSTPAATTAPATPTSASGGGSGTGVGTTTSGDHCYHGDSDCATGYYCQGYTLSSATAHCAPIQPGQPGSLCPAGNHCSTTGTTCDSGSDLGGSGYQYSGLACAQRGVACCTGTSSTSSVSSVGESASFVTCSAAKVQDKNSLCCVYNNTCTTKGKGNSCVFTNNPNYGLCQ